MKDMAGHCNHLLAGRAICDNTLLSIFEQRKPAEARLKEGVMEAVNHRLKPVADEDAG
jgi:hypothetical protein